MHNDNIREIDRDVQKDKAGTSEALALLKNLAGYRATLSIGSPHDLPPTFVDRPVLNTQRRRSFQAL